MRNVLQGEFAQVRGIRDKQSHTPPASVLMFPATEGQGNVANPSEVNAGLSLRTGF